MPTTVPRLLRLFVVLIVVLLPGTGRRAVRIVEHDIDRLRSTECEYRGIRSNFADLSIAYALTVFEEAELLHWTAEPSSKYPDTESLVTGVFSTSGVKSSSPHAAVKYREARVAAVPKLSVTWRVNTLGMLMITAHDLHAEDAIDVFRHTVDGFIAQMVVVHAATELRSGPASSHESLRPLEHGTVLLVEEQKEGWSRVRIPSTTTIGWCETVVLGPVGNE